jgi:uncharacterized membrane protein (UPF0127 family)
MTVVRALPVSLARRFAGAPRVVVSSGSVSFEAVTAERFRLRLRGLAGLEEPELVPLLFPRCRSLHTFGMRTPIDVVWLVIDEGEADVLAIEEDVGSRQLVRAPEDAPRPRTAALELRASDAVTLGLHPGTRVTLRFDSESRARVSRR